LSWCDRTQLDPPEQPRRPVSYQAHRPLAFWTAPPAPRTVNQTSANPLRILILGASVRAAAESADRAGLEVIGIDLFADADLRARFQAHRIPPETYPFGLAEVASGLPHAPWFYTGALENHPELVARVACSRPLWGNDDQVLRAVRDPLRWTSALTEAGFPCPRVETNGNRLTSDVEWLAKPLASAGGTSVRRVVSGTPGLSVPHYYQERIDGLSLSALFLGAGERTRLEGVTRQILGRAGSEFAYLGSIGPWPLPPAVLERVEAMGHVLANRFHLKGLFGVDFQLNGEHPWPVEINPRYTASVEVLELAQQRSLLLGHRALFDPAIPFPAPWPQGQTSRVVGKLILFATAPCRFPDYTRPRAIHPDRFHLPTLADRPEPGTPSETGAPITTLFASGESLHACAERLERKQQRWLHWLSQRKPPNLIKTN